MQKISLLLIAILGLVPLSILSAEERIKIGVIVPLTGPVAEYGIAAKNGIELALDQDPKLKERFKFIFEDSQYDGKQSLLAYRKLHDRDGVKIFYIWGYGPSQPVVPVAEREGSYTFSVSAETSIAKNRERTVRFCYKIDDIAADLISYLKSVGSKKVGIFKSEISYMNGLIDSMKTLANGTPSIDVIDSFTLDVVDFKSPISRLTDKGFDQVGVFLISGQISQFYKQAKQQGVKLNSIGTDFFDSSKEVNDSVGTMEGAVFSAPLASAEFKKLYVDKYGTDIQLAWAANSYEFSALINRLTSEKLIRMETKYFLDLPDQSSGAATFHFNKDMQSPGFDFKTGLKKVINTEIFDYN